MDGGDLLGEGSQPYPRAGPTKANTGGLVFKTPARETPTGQKGTGTTVYSVRFEE